MGGGVERFYIELWEGKKPTIRIYCIKTSIFNKRQVEKKSVRNSVALRMVGSTRNKNGRGLMIVKAI